MLFKTFILAQRFTPFVQRHKTLNLPLLAVKNLIEEQN
jgi:hypothetical protein